MHANNYDFTILFTIVGGNDCSGSTTAPPTTPSTRPTPLELTEAPTKASILEAGTACKVFVI